MRAIALALGAAVSLSLLGCVGAESDADDEEQAVGAAASRIWVDSPQPHGKLLPLVVNATRVTPPCARGVRVAGVPCVKEPAR
jgi:hypothetical protein